MTSRGSDSRDLRALERPPSIGGYELVGRIGGGGFGDVYAATRIHDGLAVAIKVARRDRALAGERLGRELAALRAIGPPHVPEVAGAGDLSDGTPFIVMERVELSTLEHFLASTPPMTAAAFLASARAILTAAGAAHRAGFVHRDLTPRNIFLGESPWRAKLFDFGLVRLPESGFEKTGGLTASGALLGTVAYMSPEQCEGRDDIDARADLYALGVIFYRMLTGRLPFSGSAGELVRAHVTLRPPPPTRFVALPDALSQVILHCLAKRPESRFQDVEALHDALSACAATSAAPAPTRSPASAARAVPNEPRAIPLLFFASDRELTTIQRDAVRLGGELFHAARGRYVIGFLPERAGDPLRRAIDAGHALLQRGICQAARADVVPVVIVRGRDGSVRALSASFFQPDKYPPPEERGLAHAPQTESRLVTGARDLLVGRTAILSRLTALMEAAVAGQKPSVVEILGEGGIGKSAVASALIRGLGDGLERPRVLTLRAEEALGGDREPLLRSLLDALIGPLPTEAPSDKGRAFLIDRLHLSDPSIWAAIALRLGWLEPADRALAELAAAPGALRTSVARALGEALRSLASAPSGLVLVVDDAHWADPISLDALEYAALADASAAIGICVLARPALRIARPELGRRAAHHERFELEPLAGEDGRELCRRLLHPARNVPAAALDALLARTRGVPLSLVELIRHLEKEGLIRREREQGPWILATEHLSDRPDMPAMEWLVARELGALPPALAAYAELAALIGPDCTLGEVEGLLRELEKEEGSRFTFDPGTALRELVQRGILVRTADQRHAFRHALFRESIASAASPPLKRAIHAAAARFYRRATDLPEQLRLPRLALHAELIGSKEEAAAIHATLAAEAIARHAYLDAEQRFGRVIELTDSSAVDPRLFEAWRGRGIVRYRLGRFHDALADLQQARVCARTLGAAEIEADLLLDEAMALDWLNDPLQSKARLEDAERLLDRSTEKNRSSLIDARLSLARGRTSWRHGRLTEARLELERAIAGAEQLGHAGYETRIAASLILGKILPALGQPEKAKWTLDQVIDQCRARSDLLHLAAALNNRTSVWFAIEAEDQAARDLIEFIRIGRELGMSSIEEVGEYNLAILRFREGDFESTAEHLGRVLALVEAREPGDAFRAAVLLLDARLALFRGDMDRARIVHQRLRSEEEAKKLATGGTTLLPSFRITFSLVDLVVHLAGAAEWDVLEAAAAAFPGELAEVLEMRGLLASKAGLESEAEALFERAREAAKRAASPLRVRIARTLEDLRSARSLRQ